MAWRIHEHVIRGEIDNRTRGRVTGRVWLAGVEQPLFLNLWGDCHPDLAGCALRFENPAPVSLKTRPPATEQRGTAGDITASRKVGVFDVPVAEAFAMLQRGETPPEHRANSFRLEWFSERCGHVVIESADYRLEVSEPAWRFTAEELAERERLEEDESSAFAIAVDADGNAGEWDEFRSEQMLRESDMLGEKYRLLLEKYAGQPDGERIIAREMGWPWLDEALDAANASAPEVDPHADGSSSGGFDVEEMDFAMPEPDPSREGIDWVRDDQNQIAHPVAKRARDAVHALLDELRAAGHFPECYDAGLDDFIGHFMHLSAKLGGALGGLARGGYSPDRGLIIAWLKRALEIHNETLLAANALEGGAFLTAERLAHHRSVLFGIREEILGLIARLRG